MTFESAWPRLHVRARRVQFVLWCCAVSLPLMASAVSPDIQRQVGAATFEVVLKKPEPDPLTYEKSLPLELLPYIERTDAYQSIGTAFALGHNRYVTAAHVLRVAVGSQYGAPQLRSVDSRVFEIKDILKYSEHEDFVIFSLTNDPEPPGLEANAAPRVNDPVLAVGNALGDGIVIREGLFTSETAEEQDGRWKWIRFSAAASPGNSGGPLLDVTGRLVGIVIAKSPNENLNYALPITRVLEAPEAKARFDVRGLTRLPFMIGTKTYVMKDEFALPLSWARFVKAYQALLDHHNDQAREQLLSTYANEMFPKGRGTEAILYDVYAGEQGLGIVKQDTDGEWATERPHLDDTDLPGDGKVSVAPLAGGELLQLERSDGATDDAFYSNSKAFMDIALKALNIRRQVGSDSVRVTSLGAASEDRLQTDLYGRKWQWRLWPVPFLDSYVVAALLPTPAGYSALIQLAPSSGLREAKLRLQLLTNQVELNYEGSLAQWQAFLKRGSQLPESLTGVTLASTPEWTLHTEKFEMRVPLTLLKLDLHSKLILDMAYMQKGPNVAWHVGGVWWYRDAQKKAYVGLWRQPRPPSTAKLPLRNQFNDLNERNSPYDGKPVRSTTDSFDIQTTLPVPGQKPGMVSSDVVYALNLRLNGYPSMQQIDARHDVAIKGVQILEQGVGAEVPAMAPASLLSFLDGEVQQMRDGAIKYDRQYGQDIRGRVFSQDIDDYMAAFAREIALVPTGSPKALAGDKTGGSASHVNLETAEEDMSARASALSAYWVLVPALRNNRNLWAPFLSHNHLPLDTPHASAIAMAEDNLRAALRSAAPSADWAQRARELTRAYVVERRHQVGAVKSNVPKVYRPRSSACAEPVTQTSGKAEPASPPVMQSLEEYYPTQLKKDEVEGSVVLEFRVDAKGCPIETTVIGSSGADEFDEAAIKWLESVAFFPAERDGKPIAAIKSLVVTFQLRNWP